MASGGALGCRAGLEGGRRVHATPHPPPPPHTPLPPPDTAFATAAFMAARLRFDFQEVNGSFRYFVPPPPPATATATALAPPVSSGRFEYTKAQCNAL